uniref:ABC-type nitrate/sulfonate/bicarbonate transport system, substrate-binding protein n=1 Tax=Candidatus Kentrum sp. TUN TaxID=2126343 RepID=A0A450ZJV7_9GAMM|nr:MAG: ABC-type nitrate/sulfonate/bicarbonate transport system, substrate-binding protein [Candidatus Kentron sp. TUN]VFK54086.1 MAG: ABC-type nitrate/sulfonate/bicarbonate transport system, substrate-binding protein [Candidatus Kentron sp. TUN]
MKPKNKILISLLSIVAIIILVLSSNPSDTHHEGQAPQSSTKLKIGYVSIAAGLPLFVAEKYGYFQDAGFDTELVQFKSSNEIAIAAATNQIDLIGLAATNAVIDASVTSSTTFGAFLLNGYTKPSEEEKATDYLLARKGLTIAALKGKKIAFFPGSVSRVFANLVFPKFGLDLEEIDYVEMSPPNWISSMETGVIDAVTAVEPFAQVLRDKGIVDVLVDGYYAEAMPDVPLSGAWFIEGHLSKEAEVRIYSVFQRSLEFIKTNRGKALLAFSDFTKISPDVYNKIGLNRWRLIGDDDAEESIRGFVDMLIAKGEIRQAPSSYLWVDPKTSQ